MPEEDLFSSELEGWLRNDQPKTLGALNDLFDERSFAVAILLLMFPSALPVPTGGATHVLEAVTLVLALQMIAGREEIWLPRRWRQRELGATMTGKAVPFVIRRVRTFERFSRRRMDGVFEQGWFVRLLGLGILLFTVGSVVAPPFSGLDTLPSLGVVVIALSMILRDAVFALAGTAIGVAGVLLIVFLGHAAARLVQNML
jgi:hypothetical protein